MRRRLEAPGLGNIWPAFTDVLGALVVVLVFLITIFVVSEVLVGREMLSQDTAISQLARITDYLEGLLGEANSSRERLQGQVEELQDSLTEKTSVLDEVNAQLTAARAARREMEDALRARESELETLVAEKDSLHRTISDRAQAYAALERDRTRLDAEASALQQQAALLSARTERMTAELERLNRALAAGSERIATQERELAETNERLAALGATAEDQARRLSEQDTVIARQRGRIEEMDGLIKRRLLDRVEELEAYASDFYGRLRRVFADNPDIKVVGDRFVFQSEVLFTSGEAELSSAGQSDLDKFVTVFQQVADRLPEDLDVIIEVQGHTDRVPIRTSEFRSNWELSAARALGVVNYLIGRGIPPKRLAATGMGEYHPIETSDDPNAMKRNRRIELKITSR